MELTKTIALRSTSSSSSSSSSGQPAAGEDGCNSGIEGEVERVNQTFLAKYDAEYITDPTMKVRDTCNDTLRTYVGNICCT